MFGDSLLVGEGGDVVGWVIRMSASGRVTGELVGVECFGFVLLVASIYYIYIYW